MGPVASWRAFVVVSAVVSFAWSAAAVPVASPTAPPPRVVVLGTAQDGGVPHAACHCTRCTAARERPALARRIASLAVVVPATGRTYLIDATPDVRAQLDVVHAWRKRPAGRVDRAPLDGVLLTHAHMGHYLGLAFLGKEAVSTRALPVHVSPRLGAYLRANGPWSQLVNLGNVELREFAAGQPFQLDDGVTVTALAVPHRDEYSDTVAFLLRGPRKSLLYVPDTDSWSAWKTPVADILRGVDYALVDATFYSADELPDRDVSKVPHPLVTASMDLFEPLVRAGRLRVFFTHLNHSNPLLDADGRVRRALEARGFAVLDDGAEFEL